MARLNLWSISQPNFEVGDVVYALAAESMAFDQGLDFMWWRFEVLMEQLNHLGFGLSDAVFLDRQGEKLELLTRVFKHGPSGLVQEDLARLAQEQANFVSVEYTIIKK